MGKAQPLTAKVLTPRGFIKMGDVKVGTKIIGSDGKAHRVTGVYPQGMMSVYRVMFSDGTSTECSNDHLWWTQTRNERRHKRDAVWSAKTLDEIRKSLRRPDGGRRNHIIPLVQPVEYDPQTKPLLIAPYLLGVLLGDGCLGAWNGISTAKISNPEPDVFQMVQKCLPPEDKAVYGRDQMTIYICRKKRNNEASETRKALTVYELAGTVSDTKFIPDVYLRASVEERRDLLAGLLDTDGHVNETGQTLEYATASPKLADQVCELARGLGMRVSCSSRIPTYTYHDKKLSGKRSFRVRIYPGEDNPTRSLKHAARWGAAARVTHKSIMDVKYVGRKMCQCIRVDAPNSLYITDDFIVTHNTALGLCIASNIVIDDPEAVVAFYSLEMGKESLFKRLLASLSMVNVRKVLDGWTSREDRTKMSSTLIRVAELHLEIDDTTAMTTTQMRAKSRRLKQQRGRLDLIVVDYLQLMSGSKRYGNRQEEVASVSRGLKALSKELDVPVIALAQLHRGSEQRSGDKRPMLSDLRESGQIEQDGDIVAFIHRGEVYAAEDDPDAEHGIAEIITAKNREGSTGTRKLAYLADYTRFETLAVERN